MYRRKKRKLEKLAKLSDYPSDINTNLTEADVIINENHMGISKVNHRENVTFVHFSTRNNKKKK